MFDEEDFLNVIECGLLETDIAEESYNACVWNRSEKSDAGRKSGKAVVRNLEVMKNLQLADTSPMHSVVKRSHCRICHRSAKFFCYKCFEPLPLTEPFIPRIRNLPFSIDIIKHPAELDGKSTASHVKIICPDDVNIFRFPDQCPDYRTSDDHCQTYLCFPGKQAGTMEKLSAQEALTFSGRRLRLVFIDSTWAQTNRMLRHPHLSSLPQLKLQDRSTVFWRHQSGQPDQSLATVEAVYYSLLDYLRFVLGEQYHGQYDNLLFLYKFMLEKLHSTYAPANDQS